MRCRLATRFLIGFVLSFSPLAWAGDVITVRLGSVMGPVTRIVVAGPFQLQGEHPLRYTGHSAVFRVKQGKLVMLPSGKGPAVFLGTKATLKGDARHGLGLVWPSGKRRYYAGTVVLRPQSGETLDVRNNVQRQAYVASVVGSETQAGWPEEALKVQAVLTQTRLAALKPGTVLVDSTQQEAYLGQEYARPAVWAAVQAVWGQTLQYKGRPITVLYHSTCAGKTSDNRVFGGKPLSYLQGRSCPYCRRSPFFEVHKAVIPRSQWQSAFSKAIPRVLSVDAAGRPLQVMVDQGQVQSGYAFWLQLGQRWGWDKVPGLRFRLAQSADGSLLVTSWGAGHGVGLCQWGARQMALFGTKYADILAYYYPGTHLAGGKGLNR